MKPIARITFEWSFSGYGHEETFKHTVRCVDALERCVPFLKPWKTALGVVAAIDKLHWEAIRASVVAMKNSNVDCQLLGAPKPADELDTLCGTTQVVVLKSATGERQDNYRALGSPKMSGYVILAALTRKRVFALTNPSTCAT